MQAITINTIVSSFNAFLKAGGTFGQVMQQAAQANIPATELIPALANATAKHFGATVRYTNRGNVGFYSDAEGKVRHDAARKCWERNVAPFFKPTESKPVVRKQVDKIEAMATRLQKQLSKRELNRLLTLLSQ